MLTHVTAARDMRGDEDALVVPEATIGFMFELTHIDVEGHPRSFPAARAAINASSSMISPRATFTRIAPGFMAAKASRPISLVVSGVH